MKLSDLLFKYEANATLKQVLSSAKFNPKAYVTITETEAGYKAEPTFTFYKSAGCDKASLALDKNLNITFKACSCLEFHRKQDCIHEVALYSICLMILDNSRFEAEYNEFKHKQISKSHNEILQRLSKELKTANAYSGLIHLIPCVEIEDSKYYLSLKIGFDKDYVIKNINQFITCMENNLEFSYGQKLTFIHSYECLDDMSKEFYSFLCNIANEKSEKNILMKKSRLLKLLEIFKGQTIYYKAMDEAKATPRVIVKTNDVGLILDANRLYISSPNSARQLVSGVNNAYFIDDDNIYAYNYKSRVERKVYDCLFRITGGLLIDINSQGFISELLPMIKGITEIKKEFYEKYPIPELKINSYISYKKDNIYLDTKIACNLEDRNSPYIKELLESYYNVIQSFYFAKNKDGIYNICNIENQYKFLTSDISAIKSFGNVYFDESMKSIRAKKSNRTSVSISYNVGLLDFEFTNSDLTIEEIQEMLKAYHEKKSFVKLKDNSILEINTEDAKRLNDFLEDFNISLADISNKISKPLNYILKLVNSTDNNLVCDDEIVSMINKIQGYKKSKYMPQEEFINSLREYQIDGFKWLKTLASFGFGGILADDMGLGKTLQIISFISSDDESKPSLIVCPMSLVYNWQNECEKWGLKCPVRLIIGGAEERLQAIENISSNQKILYITSYDSLRRDISLYTARFRFVIADEAQFIKNQFAQKSEAIKSLKSEINFALTGTPIENGLSDLWSIFDYLMPGYLSNYSRFKSRYEALIMHQDNEALDKLQKRITPFILRRTKKDVLKELPDKIEEYYYCKMQNKQKEVYDAYVGKLKDDIKGDGNKVLSLITRLRQICITPELIFQEPFENTKINMAIDLIKSSVDANHRILLFSQFAQSFPIISKELDKMGIKHFILDGVTKAKTRIEMVDEYNNNEDIKVFIISLKAGGTGLNLVGADMVIHLDPWWNVSAENQATDRAYRIGQTKNVHVIKLICKDTIEEKVVKLQNVKRELAESVVHSDEQHKIKLSKEDILELLD